MQLPRRHEEAKSHKKLIINQLPWINFVPLRLRGKKRLFGAGSMFDKEAK
jgi:hypothetical protein